MKFGKISLTENAGIIRGQLIPQQKGILISIDSGVLIDTGAKLLCRYDKQGNPIYRFPKGIIEE
jgi:hypothetical protein